MRMTEWKRIGFLRLNCPKEPLMKTEEEAQLPLIRGNQ